jgi:hypothetical protein
VTVGELIKELQKYPDNMIVINEDQEDSWAPFPRKECHSFEFHYWENSKLLAIPKHQEFIKL